MTLFQRRRHRLGDSKRPFPSTTTELTPDDYRVIRTALVIAITTHTSRGADPAAQAATLTLDKISKVVR